MKKITLLFIFIVVIATSCFKKNNKEGQKDIKDIVIKDSGWSYVQSDMGNYISYGVEIYNPSKNCLVKTPVIKVVGKDDNDNIVFSFDDTLSYISSSDTIYFGKTAKVDNKPIKVDITVEINGDNYVEENTIENVKNTDIEVSSINEKVKENIREYNGQIRNNSSIDLSKLIISVIYKKDKKIVGGSYSYVYSIKSGDTLEFNIYTVNTPDYDEYEVSVTPSNNIS